MPTLSELRTIVRLDPLLNSTTVVADAALNTLLNEGAVQLARDGDAFILTTTWNTTASTSDYILSGGASPKASGFLDIYWPTGGLTYTQSSGVIKMAPADFRIVSENLLNREFPGWQTATASDTLQYVMLSFDSSGNLILKTSPAAETTTPSFKLWYKSRGTDMSADANYPYVNGTNNLTHIEPYQKAIAYWASYVLHRDKTKQADSAKHFLDLYTLLASQCKQAQRKLFEAELHGQREDGYMMAAQTFGSL